MTRFLDGVEWLGNLLPHPVTLFAILAGLMIWPPACSAAYWKSRWKTRVPKARADAQPTA